MRRAFAMVERRLRKARLFRRDAIARHPQLELSNVRLVCRDHDASVGGDSCQNQCPPQ